MLAAVAALAAWLDYSRLQEGHHGDSLVPVLTGLTAWTPFFWGTGPVSASLSFHCLRSR